MTERRAMPGWVKGLLFVLALAVLVAAVVVIIKYAPRPPREMLDADAGTPVRIEVHELRSGNDAVIEDPETAETVAAAFRGHTFRRNGGTYGMQGYTLHFFFEDGSENIIEMQWETSLRLGNYSYIPADGADYSAVWSMLTGLFAAEDREVESVTVREITIIASREATTTDRALITALRNNIRAIETSGTAEDAGMDGGAYAICFRYADGSEQEYLLGAVGLSDETCGKIYPTTAELWHALGIAAQRVIEAQTSSAAQLTAADASYWDACEKHMFTAPDTAVRTEPRDDAPVGRTLSGWTVRVCAVVWADDTEPWALVTCFTFDSAVNNTGWVRWSSLIEYTAETRESLRYPVGVAEGARDSATGELIWPAGGEYAVEYRDGAAYLTREGGDAWTVKPEDVVYPEV